MLIIVSVQKYHIFLPIGWYEDEIRIKTEVFIDVEVQYESSGIKDDLGNTIDYAEIHRLIKRLSNTNHKLLESFGELCLMEIKEQFNFLNLKYAMIRITKPQILEKESSCLGQTIELRMDF